jgi:hypothetical protein
MTHQAKDSGINEQATKLPEAMRRIKLENGMIGKGAENPNYPRNRVAVR